MRLLNLLHRYWLRHQLRNIADAIAYEEARHRSHHERIAHWLDERAQVRAELRILEHGPRRLSSQLLAGRPARP